MFFILSKTLTYLILPVPLLAICLLVFLLAPKRRLKGGALLVFSLLFLLYTNPFISNSLMTWWEVPPTPIAALSNHYDAAIILSGVTATAKDPQDRVHLHKGADRIMHTVQLYKLGKLGKIIVSGGSGTLLSEEENTEAEKMKKVLLISGVAEEDIWLEESSRNTHENALFTQALLQQKNLPKDRLLLVTSAFHMRRALGCFHKAGLEPLPYSVDFYSFEPKYTPDELLIPSDGAIITWTRLTREWTGYLMYVLMGYV